jgi:nucleotide-binding universal stress UspA family protein
MDDSTERKIVVGVDGSPSSVSALRWALKQAELTGSTVHAIAAWDFPAFYSWEGGPLPPEDFEQATRMSLDNAVDGVLGTTEVSVPIHREVRHGHSVRVIVDAAKGADLLVIGSRGHGTLYGALLGSVSQRCAQHAACPVVIVRSCGG